MISATTLRYAVAWLVLMMSFAALVGGFNWPTYWKLAHRGVPVQGAVIQVLPQVHATVRYRYFVDGMEYRGQNQPRKPNPAIESIVEGAVVTVFYDPEKPEISVLGLPSGLLENETISVVSAAIISPTLILLYWRYRMRDGYKRLWAYLRDE